MKYVVLNPCDMIYSILILISIFINIEEVRSAVSVLVYLNTRTKQQTQHIQSTLSKTLGKSLFHFQNDRSVHGPAGQF